MQVDSGEREQQRMAALRRYHLLDIAPNERFDRITQLIAHIFGVPTAVITLIDEHRQWFASRVGLIVRETARDIAFCNRTIRTDEVLVVSDAQRSPLFAENPLVTGELGLRFYAGAPLRTPDGHNIGTVAVIGYEPREFAAWERHTLAELARFVMSEFELWRRLHEADERHRAEVDAMARQHRSESLLAERRFRALIENSPDLTLVLNRELQVSFASPSCARLLGYGTDELLGSDVVETLLRPEQRDEARAWFEELIAGAHATESHAWTLRSQRGADVEVVATGQNLFAEPAVAGIVVNARDVSAELRARKELEHARERLRQVERMEAVGRLAGGVAHDFNNLLTVVLNSAAFALRKLPEHAAACRDVQQIIEAAERGATLTRQILTLTQNRPSSLETLDPNQLVRAVLELLRRVVGERISVTFSPGQELPPICADRAQLEQVLINLCVNARDAIEGTGTICIATALTVAGEELAVRYPWVRPGLFVTFSLRDNGVGMPPRVAEHAFEPFFTTKPVGKGTGLGLATSYGCVRQHRGFIELESTVGVGTEVRIALPAQVSRSASEAGSGAERHELAGLRGYGAVLLAQDDDLVRRVTQGALEEAGYRVYPAGDGAEAVELFAAHSGEIRLCVLDAELPRLTGAEALARMRGVRAELEYVLVSGYDLAAEGVPEGRWLAKPYRAEHLVARVHALLGD